jgi:hypothetical protein
VGTDPVTSEPDGTYEVVTVRSFVGSPDGAAERVDPYRTPWPVDEVAATFAITEFRVQQLDPETLVFGCSRGCDGAPADFLMDDLGVTGLADTFAGVEWSDLDGTCVPGRSWSWMQPALNGESLRITVWQLAGPPVAALDEDDCLGADVSEAAWDAGGWEVVSVDEVVGFRIGWVR